MIDREEEKSACNFLESTPLKKKVATNQCA